MADLPLLMQEEQVEKRRLLGETKLEQERLRKKEMRKAEAALDEIGQPNEKKGIRATQKAYREYQAENFRIKSDRIAWLNAKAKYAKKKLDYYRHVDTIVRYELSFLELPPGYTVKSDVNKQGIKLLLVDRWQQIHAGAFTPCGLGLYDEQACRTSVNKLDDAISYLEAHPPSGVYLK
jgi:hypothetical protein